MDLKVNVNTKKFIRQLGVIEEGVRNIKKGLEEIEKNSCVECGAGLEVTTMYADDGPVCQTVKCPDCKTEQYVHSDL